MQAEHRMETGTHQNPAKSTDFPGTTLPPRHSSGSFAASPPRRYNQKNLRFLPSSAVLTIRFGLKREGFSGSFGDQRVNRSLAGSQNGGYDLAAQRR